MKTINPLTRAAIWCALYGAASLAQAGDATRLLAAAADPGQLVPATRYQALPLRPAAGVQGSPAQRWKALNEQVGSYDAMSLTAQAADQPAPTQAPGSAATAEPGHEHHAGHGAPAASGHEHAAHMAPAAGGQHHAGHAAPAASHQHHAGHAAPNAADPHAAHKQKEKK